MSHKKLILSILKQELDHADREYKCAIASRVACVAAYYSWREQNPMDGVGSFSRNPHNVIQADMVEEKCRVDFVKLKEAYEYAIDTFIVD